MHIWMNWAFAPPETMPNRRQVQSPSEIATCQRRCVTPSSDSTQHSGITMSLRVYLALFTSPRVGQQRNSRNLRNAHAVQAVCEFVRMKSSLAFGAVHFSPRSVRGIRVSSRQHVIQPA